MLINFTFKNVRSFRDEKTLSLEATSIQELKASIISRGGYKLLPAIVLYGANSSGKSNVLTGLSIMRHLVINSVRLNPMEELPFEPFCLDDKSIGLPTSFEIEFLLNDTKYRYGFEYDEKQILSEWLFEKKVKQREFNLFYRAENEFEISKTRFSEGLGKEKSTPKNRLFVSLVAQLNGEKSQEILSWFKKCNTLSGLSSKGYRSFTLKMLNEKLPGYEDAIKFFHDTQLGFQDLKINKEEFREEMLTGISAPESIKKQMLNDLQGETIFTTKTTHNVYDSEGKLIGIKDFDKDKMESEGTKKVIELSGPIFDTLTEGGVLLVDELDAKLHPFLTIHILRLFMSPKTNPNGAQLIFTTHDTKLLNLKYLRRDQIWFTQKDDVECSDLFSLSEFKDDNGAKVRNDRDIESDYISGRYGAVPFI